MIAPAERGNRDQRTMATVASAPWKPWAEPISFVVVLRIIESARGS
ncbi:hypothetical protein RMSM_01922 [Rhodopirellula maiorica SM1]|uniref:Uncharacterized protein n=1 Tax=Rhodopirellula maiorica SM1 TaxID=1265738 RepID=M5RPB1_9BACT|nr:hypothetical protein RMSM_01922 [Rhodopirellula maiorica SM1]